MRTRPKWRRLHLTKPTEQIWNLTPGEVMEDLDPGWAESRNRLRGRRRYRTDH